MKYFEAHPVESFKDANGSVPEILMVDGNRTGGKTTGFSRLLVSDFMEKGEKFFLVYRYKNELRDVAEAFFKDIKTLFFPEHEMIAKAHADGSYMELFLDGVSCGYASSLGMAGKLKRYSHIFSDVSKMFFDEYQSESGIYLPDEPQKLISLHTTIARGQGQAVRFVPVYMCSNSVSIFNPYYIALGITARINSRTKILKGEGFVLLRLVIKDVAEAQKTSAFNRAFSGSNYLASANDNSFLNDDDFNVRRSSGSPGFPVFTFRLSGYLFTCYRAGETFTVKKGGDPNFSPCFGVLESDRGSGVIAFRNSAYVLRMRRAYEDALIFYDTVEVKHAFQMLLVS